MIGHISAKQFGRVCPVVQCLHELSPWFSPMFVCCLGYVVVHLFQGGRGVISGSEVISCSHLFEYFRWDRLCINTVPSRGYMFFFAVCLNPHFAQFVLHLLTISVPVCLLGGGAGTMSYRVDLQTNGDW